MSRYTTGIFVNKDILENNWIDTENLLDNWTFDDMLNYLETVVGATGTSSNIGLKALEIKPSQG